MTHRILPALVLLAAFTCLSAHAAHGGGGRGGGGGGGGHRHMSDDNPDAPDQPEQMTGTAVIDFILEHGSKLKLTTDQVHRVITLRDGYKKLITDPQIMELMQKGKNASRQGDAEQIAAVQKQLHDLMLKKTSGMFGSVDEAVEKILTKEQAAQAAELHEIESQKVAGGRRRRGDGGGDGGGGGGAPASLAANPFE